MIFQNGWVLIFAEKNKRETGGLDKPPVSPMWRRWRKDPVMAPNAFPPKEGEKYCMNYIKLVLKKY
jgi:hypothetical protein